MQRRFERGIDSLDKIFAFINEFLTSEGLGEEVSFPIDLAVEELFTNMVKYNTGGGREISIGITKKDDTVVLELVDFDVDPFDPSMAKQAVVDGAIEDRQIGGLGLRLVRSVVDKITYEYKNRRMKVSVFKKLER